MAKRMRTEFGEFRAAGFLQGRIVVRVHIVQPNDVAAVLQKTPRNVEADKSGSTSDEDGSVSHWLYSASVGQGLKTPQIDSFRLQRPVKFGLDV